LPVIAADWESLAATSPTLHSPFPNSAARSHRGANASARCLLSIDSRHRRRLPADQLRRRRLSPEHVEAYSEAMYKIGRRILDRTLKIARASPVKADCVLVRSPGSSVAEVIAAGSRNS